MGKLIKYELRKQRASRMVIFIALAIALVGFWTGILFMNNTLMGVSAAAMVFGAVFVLFYTGIEGILVFNRDLRTKQSYMLWMLPRSIWEGDTRSKVYFSNSSDADCIRHILCGGRNKHSRSGTDHRRSFGFFADVTECV